MNRRRFATVAAGLFGGLFASKLSAQKAVNPNTNASPETEFYSMKMYTSEVKFIEDANRGISKGFKLYSFSKQGGLIHAVYQKI